jgi:transposase
MNALLLDDGWTAEQVAAVLFIDAETVREHRRLYQASGVAGIARLKYEGAASDLSEEPRAALGAELDARLYMTANAVCAFVQRTFEVTYTPHAMAKLLKRLDFVYKMPKKVPAKADEAVQRQFVAEVLVPRCRRPTTTRRCISLTGPIRRTPRTPRMAGSARARPGN